jgi:hypothetical protein
MNERLIVVRFIFRTFMIVLGTPQQYQSIIPFKYLCVVSLTAVAKIQRLATNRYKPEAT